MANIEQLIVQQKLTATQLEKYQVNFRKDSERRKTRKYLEKLIARVQVTYEFFIVNHDKIISSSTNEDLKHEYFINDIFNEVEYSQILFQAELEEWLDRVKGEAAPIKSNHHSNKSDQDELDLRLPRITLPKFAGTYDSWIPFRDLFLSLIHKRETLSNVEKLHYLKCNLSGEAEKLLAQLQITDANYLVAWNTLVERYDNRNALTNIQFKKLMTIANANECASSLKSLLDKTMECVQSIDQMGIQNLWHTTVVYLTTQRLPIETRQLWEQQQSSSSELSSLESLKTFIQNRFRALEASGIERPRQTKTLATPSNIRSVHTSQQEGNSKCAVCQGHHPIKQCQQFDSQSPEDRFKLAKSIGLCINCLRKGHSITKCSSKSRCLLCAKPHHTLLHRDDSNATSVSSNNIHSETEHVTINSLSTTTNRHVILATALITLEGVGGPITLRALLDQGSQASLITQSAADQLGLPRKATNLQINGVGKAKVSKVKGVITTNLITHDNERVRVEALILSKLTDLVPSRSVISSNWTRLTNLRLADPYFDRPGQIDILLGADVYANIILNGLEKLSFGVIAQNTKVGWIVSGYVETTPTTATSTCFNITLNDNNELNEQLRNFWELEEIPAVPSLTLEEEQCESHFLENVKRKTDGRYTVKLPFKSEAAKDSLGSSRYSALGSLLSLEKRLQRNPDLKHEYHTCIKEYLDLGHMRPANGSREHAVVDGQKRCVAYYLPHHAVHKESSTTKCRVVFNASRKTTTGISLNDVLLTGPKLLNCMLTVLMKWRFPKYAIMADVEKMYRNVNVYPEDAEFQRLLWRFDPEEDVEDFCLTTVTFGYTCAAYLATRVMQKLAEDEKQRFPIAAQAILDEFYVDDWLSGDDDLNATIEKRDETRSLLAAGGFRLRKWIANDTRLLRSLPADDVEMSSNIDLNLECGYKSLGMIWNPVTDHFSYQLRLEKHIEAYTKRELLSDISRLYDPLGWLAPITIVAKTLMQSLWLHGSCWDETIPLEISQKWSKLRNDLNVIGDLRIPRWLHTQKTTRLEFHGFCDASTTAYAAVLYLVVYSDNEVNSYLIMAKTKVAPIKTVSIPRLELCGAVLIAKLVTQVKKALNFENVDTWLWTDSQVVLSWLQGHPTRWATFVANRTSEILQTTGNTPWRYVPSKQNPADLASRGIAPNGLTDNELWWNGPPWLRESPCNWPLNVSIKTTEMERRKDILIHLSLTHNSDLDELLNKFSTMNRLVRVTAYCFRFYDLVSKRTASKNHLNASELQRSFDFWIKYTQRTHFENDMDDLANEDPSMKLSNLSSLHPFVDRDGFLRVGGRLTNATLPYAEKHPIILPKNGRFVKLLLEQMHKATLHGQVQLMLAAVRKRFWTLRGRNAVKNIIRQCIVCFRTNAKVSRQLMGSYPAPRVTVSRPFTNTGIDFCGPLDLKDRKGRGSKTSKGYIAVFICLAVKAIHLEVVSDLTTPSFLAALRRFMGRRGLCANIYSDHGTNFVGANAELNRVFKLASDEAAELLANDGIAWHFIPPAAPHFGGLWEAGVKSVKRHLHRVLRDALLTYEEMTTILTQIEACLNSRPLCPLYDDPDGTTALTPGHFLIGDTLLAPPDVNLTNLRINQLDRWQHVQRLTQMFWMKWKAEYLTRLQQRPKWLKPESGPCIGDLCLVKDDRLASFRWPLARIIDIHPGKDGLVRVISLKMGSKTYKRPITKIALLPTQQQQID